MTSRRSQRSHYHYLQSDLPGVSESKSSQSPRLGKRSWCPQAPACERSPTGPAPMAIDASPVLAFWSTHLVHLFLQGPLMLFHLLPWRPGGAHSVRYKMHSNHKTEIRVQKTSREAGGAQVLGPENHSRGISFFLGLTGVAEVGDRKHSAHDPMEGSR